MIIKNHEIENLKLPMLQSVKMPLNSMESGTGQAMPIPFTVSGSYPGYIHPFQQSQVQNLQLLFLINSSFPAVPGTVSSSYPGHIHPFQQSQVRYSVHIPDTFILSSNPWFRSRIHSSFPTISLTVSGSYSRYIYPVQQSQVQYLFLSWIHSFFPAIPGIAYGSYFRIH